MKFISLTTMIMSAAVLVAAGGPCYVRASAGYWECGNLEDYNGGNAFLYYCSPPGYISNIQDCSCETCCSVVSGGVGPKGHTSCT
ncbi:hypothetical protein BDR03DRAFT_968178 [Suillus americanus]|nr:hypothetical protein BDR03DRAFT_968178 [Suillus americanus]